MAQRLQQFSQIPQQISSLDFTATSVSTPAVEAYCEFYQLNFDETEHIWGTFASGQYQLVAHIFRPHHPRGTVFLLHGYIDHTGILHHLIQNCLEQQYVVAVYDLPGHGLSSGERISIDSFPEYVNVFENFLVLCKPHVPQPYHLICHSTGGAIALEYLLEAGTHPFKRIVFLAPLVRHVHWHISKIPYALGKLVHIRTVPRRTPEISSDPAFLRFLQSDPLQPHRVPVKWISALYSWNRKIAQTAPVSQAVCILQGTRDNVVDWKYNLPFLQEKLTGATVKTFQNAKHHLPNESLPIRTQVFESINAYLEYGKM